MRDTTSAEKSRKLTHNVGDRKEKLLLFTERNAILIDMFEFRNFKKHMPSYI